jgi:MarR family transcriptional regulator for hemolysin
MALLQHDTLGFLLHDVARLMRWEFERKAQNTGLTRSQWRLLLHLARDDGMQQKQLVRILDVTAITLTGLLDRLERDGWIERRDDPTDRRAKRVYLTARVKDEGVIQNLQAIGAEVRQSAVNGLDKQQVQQLMEALQLMRENLSARQEETTAQLRTA